MNRTAVLYALTSAALFGVSTPAAKFLVGSIHPVTLAGLLYCGAGIGVAALRRMLPAAITGAPETVVGFLGYGVSLALFVVALRGLGTARTGAYFSTAPFIGSAAAVVFLGEPITAQLLVAAALMAIGVWLHLTEHHEHEHDHEALVHTHPHVHDIHHRHTHKATDPPGEPHTHSHEHWPVRHLHPHVPDMHHTHRHN